MMLEREKINMFSLHFFVIEFYFVTCMDKIMHKLVFINLACISFSEIHDGFPVCKRL